MTYRAKTMSSAAVLPLSATASPSPARFRHRLPKQPLLVEMPPVGHAGVKAVAVQIVHLVDVDRAGEHSGEDLARRVAGFFAQQGHHVAGIDVPIVPQHVGDLAFQQKLLANNSWLGTLGN